MKVNVVNAEKSTTTMNTLAIGEVGVVLEGMFIGHYLLRTYTGSVSLQDPRLTWDEACILLVSKVPSGTKLVLETR